MLTDSADLLPSMFMAKSRFKKVKLILVMKSTEDKSIS